MIKFFKLDSVEKIIATLISIFAGMVFGLVVMLLINPIMAFGGLSAILLSGVSNGMTGFGSVLFNAAPLILT